MGKTGWGGYRPQRLALSKETWDFFDAHASGFVDMLHCCDLFPGQKTWALHFQSIHIAAFFSSILESLVWCSEQSGWADVFFD